MCNPASSGFVDLDRGGIARIDDEKCLDLRVEKLIEFALGILPATLGIGVNRDFYELDNR